MANDGEWKFSGSTSVDTRAPRQNRPRNTLLTGIKIYLNGAPHYPARGSIVRSRPGEMEPGRGGGKRTREVAKAGATSGLESGREKGRAFFSPEKEERFRGR